MLDKKADLAGPGIGNHAETERIIQMRGIQKNSI